MAAGLDGPRRPPASGARAEKLVVFAHGYGSNGDDLISLAPYLAQRLPNAAFVSPSAPESVPGMAGARQWFPISAMDPQRLAKGVGQAATSLNGFIDAELARLALRPADCALVGFSQGTMMALHVGLRRPEPLGAVVGFSGLLAAPETLARELRSRPPVLLAHGDRDDRIPVTALVEAAGDLGAAGVPVLWRICGGAGHTITEDGLELAAAFLHAAFRGRLAGWASPEQLR